MVANPADRGQLDRDFFFSLPPFAPGNLVSQDVSSVVHDAWTRLFSVLRLNLI